MLRQICLVTIYAVLLQIYFFVVAIFAFCREIDLVAIYALFRRGKLKEKIVSVEKKEKYQVCF